ncbi:MAG: hypothetical protein KGH89_07655 [Thaumarchaeota archaeon]|nr:hypothetical protein [Nitrososphaerota archaeon]
MSSSKDNHEKVRLRSQLILALIPSFISQMIAFYRIRKVLYGIIIEVAIFFIALVINLVISWPIGMVFALPITVGIPVYYIRKWTMEFNRADQGMFG